MQILGMAVYMFATLGSFICKVISIPKICDFFSLKYVQHIICIPPPNNLYKEGGPSVFLIDYVV